MKLCPLLFVILFNASKTCFLSSIYLGSIFPNFANRLRHQTFMQTHLVAKCRRMSIVPPRTQPVHLLPVVSSLKGFLVYAKKILKILKKSKKTKKNQCGVKIKF